MQGTLVTLSLQPLPQVAGHGGAGIPPNPAQPHPYFQSQPRL